MASANVVVAAGTGSEWTADGDALADDLAALDASYVRTTIATSGVSQRLECTGFGLSVPVNARGVWVRVYVTAAVEVGSSGIMLARLELDGVSIGSNIAKQEQLAAQDATITYGAGGWGVELTPELLNDPTFGFRVNFNAPFAESSIRVDAIALKAGWLRDTAGYPVMQSVAAMMRRRRSRR